jgi:hypothetical protein
VYDFPWKRIVLTAVWIALSATVANAQGPSISLPGGSIYKAGPDYASDVLQDPWDFDNVEDLSPDPDEFGGWVAPAPAAVRLNGPGHSFLSNGWMRGTAAGDTRLSLLHRTFADTLKPGRTGARYPIDPSAYRKMAVKMRVTGAQAADNLVVYWWHRFIVEGPDWASRGGGAAFSPVIPAGNSGSIYVIDLAQAQLIGPTDPYTTGPVKALWIDPTGSGGPKTLEIDWVRLTAADNDPNASLIPVQLNGCTQFQALTVTDADGFSTRIQDAAGDTQVRRFNAGVFPPGNYNVRAACTNGETAPVGFQINAPPRVTVLNPDEKGDPATDWALMKGDPWDFEQPTDVDRIANVTVSQGPCATNGPCGLVPTQFPGRTGLMFRASSWRDPGPAGHVGDPALGILESAIVPLNSLKHRLLTFSLRTHRPYDLAVGSVARFFWGSAAASDGNSVTTSQDMLVFPGPQTYTIDLATLTSGAGGIETVCPGCPPTWAARAIRHFRIDPHEFGDVPTGFDIDDVTLTAPDEVALGQAFAVTFAIADADAAAGSTYSARIYAQPWPARTPGGRTLLGTMPGIGPGQHTFSFQPLARGIPEGQYTISVEVDEGRGGMTQTQTSRAFATGMLVVSGPAASTPKLSVSYPQPNQSVGLPLTIQGCAYDDGRTTGGINVDDIAISMRAIAGPRAGMTIPLGFEPVVPHTGRLEFGPLGSVVPCPTGAGPYANAGFRVTGIGAGLGDWMNGTWMVDVRARSTLSGELVPLAEIPFVIGPAAPPAPENFQASAAGNTVTVSWQPPPGGGAAYYQIQGSLNPSFAPLAFSINVPGTGPYSGQLGSGRYYLRVYARSASGVWSSPSLARQVDVALPTAPGAPTLVATHVSANPVTINWSPGPGGAPASYTIHAGTSPGASNLLVAPMGLATGVTAVAPVGTPIYVRVVAQNAAGAAMSNEIGFALVPPSPPTLHPPAVSGHTVTLGWSPAGGGAPSLYTVRARYPGSATIIASLPVAGTAVTVPAVPSGSYVVTVVSHNAQGTSAESNAITVTVP